jgi:hypothetical protein
VAHRSHGYDTATCCDADNPLLQLRWETNVKNGVCGVAFDRRDIPMNKFVISCLESAFHVYDARTQHPHKASVCVCVSEHALLCDDVHAGWRGLADTSTPCHTRARAHAQGFASTTQHISSGAGAGSSSGCGSTVWGAHHLPQNRDVAMVAAGDGSLSLWKYRYPDQRKVKVRARVHAMCA